MHIEVIDPESGVNVSMLETAIKRVFSGENETVDYINVIFLPRDDLRQLKNEYFGLDVYTDVIAFNLNDPEESLEGEIYLSLAQIKQNAETFKARWSDELMRVIIHGCLHLCGYEDDTTPQKEQMTSLEDIYIKQTYDLESEWK